MVGSWLHKPDAVAALAGQVGPFSRVASHLQGVGAGKVALLYKAVTRVIGKFEAGPQQEGDCGGHSGATGADLVACLDVVSGQHEEYTWERRASVEWVYGLAREYGNYLGQPAGAATAWVVRALLQGGVVGRHVMRVREDAPEYSGTLSNRYGATGVPRRLLPIARVHRVVSASQVRTAAEVRDSVCAGCPVLVGYSGVGFNGKRDRHGFIAPNRPGDRPWDHMQVVVGYRDDGIEGYLLKNHSGPDEHSAEPQGKYPIPGCCWWVRPNVLERMIKGGGYDSWSITGFNGYKPDHKLMELITA